MKLIDKDALVAEIEKLRDAALTRQHNLERIGQVSSINEQVAFNLNKVLSFIDTLEVKEVDLERYCNEYFKGWSDYQGIDGSVTTPVGRCVTIDDIKEVCEHFFELGLKAKQS